MLKIESIFVKINFIHPVRLDHAREVYAAVAETAINKATMPVNVERTYNEVKSGG